MQIHFQRACFFLFYQHCLCETQNYWHVWERELFSVQMWKMVSETFSSFKLCSYLLSLLFGFPTICFVFGVSLFFSSLDHILHHVWKPTCNWIVIEVCWITVSVYRHLYIHIYIKYVCVSNGSAWLFYPDVLHALPLKQIRKLVYIFRL